MVNHLKKGQADFSKRLLAQNADTQYEGNRYHDYFRALPFLAVRSLLQDRGVTLTGKSGLVASCGQGTDIHHLRKWYDAAFSVTDISENAVAGTLAHHHDGVIGWVADTEVLPFPDNSFDFSFIHNSLHHLPRPTIGLYELLRVARLGVIGIEPNDSWLTRAATRLGLATEIEAAGNYVYRFGAWDIQRVTKALFYQCHIRQLFALHRVANSAGEFAALRFLNGFANLLVPRMGNYIVFWIEK